MELKEEGWNGRRADRCGVEGKGQTEVKDGREDGKSRGRSWSNAGSSGRFVFLFFQIPRGHALICCVYVCVRVCALSYGVMGTCKVTSLSVLSLGRDYRLLLGCVASSQPYYSRCWTGYSSSVYTSLTNTIHTEEII